MGFIYDIYRLCSGDINGLDLWIAFGSRYTTNAPPSLLFFPLPSSRIDLLKGPHLIDPGDLVTCLDVCGINRATPGDLCSRDETSRKSESFWHSQRVPDSIAYLLCTYVGKLAFLAATEVHRSREINLMFSVLLCKLDRVCHASDSTD